MSPGRRVLLQALSLGALVAAWEVAARTGQVDPLFVPAPSAVVRAFRVIGPEAVGLLGKTWVPVLPPWGTGLVAGPLRRLGFRIPDEMIDLLRFDDERR